MKHFFFILKNRVAVHKTVILNFSYLSVLQVFNLLIPLITYPYLIRVLGKETYGLIVFAQAIVAYLVVLVSFGFNITAVRDISIYRENKDKISEIFSCVTIIKCLLFVFAFIVLGISILFIPTAYGHEVLFLISMWACLFDVIFPVWYFQGIEQMKYITYITLISRLVFLGLIFIYIKSPTDFLIFPLINGIGAVIAGSIALFVIFKKHKVKFKFQSYKKLKYYFLDSIPIFISNISIVLYVNTNKVIIGSFLGMGEVAYYDLAEKITSILKLPQSILSQTLFPKISKDKDMLFIQKIFLKSILFHCLLVFIVLIFSSEIVIALGGNEMSPAIWVVNILVLSIPVIIASNILGIQVLIPFGYKKLFSKIIISSGFIYGILILILNFTFGFSIIKISSVTVLTEIFVTAYMYYYIKKLNLWKKNTII